MRKDMIVLYIIGGFVCLLLAIYVLYRREKMSKKINKIKEQNKEIQ